MQGGDIPDVVREPPPHMRRPGPAGGPKCRCTNCGELAAAEFNVPCHARRCPRCGAPMVEDTQVKDR